MIQRGRLKCQLDPAHSWQCRRIRSSLSKVGWKGFLFHHGKTLWPLESFLNSYVSRQAQPDDTIGVRADRPRDGPEAPRTVAGMPAPPPDRSCIPSTKSRTWRPTPSLTFVRIQDPNVIVFPANCLAGISWSIMTWAWSSAVVSRAEYLPDFTSSSSRETTPLEIQPVGDGVSPRVQLSNPGFLRRFLASSEISLPSQPPPFR